MKENFKKFITQFITFWKSLTRKKKAVIIGTFAGAAAVISIVVTIANSVNYSPLYLGLDASEAGEILEKVQQMNIPVEAKGTGNIYVDSRQVDAVKMKLAEEGYPKTTLSYDIFMKGTSWAMTDSDKQKLAVYQVQDRLQDTINTIPGVKSSEVTIADPDQNSYVLSTDNSSVTASVKVNLETGTSLDSQQVKGIVLLVSRSVPDLDAKNVSVLDGDGSPLTNDDGTDGSDERLELQKKAEDMVKAKIMSLLTPVCGEGNIQVAAGVTLDFSQTTTSKTTYYPSSSGLGIPQSIQRTTQQNTAQSTSGTTQYTGQTASQSTASGAATGTENEETSYLVNTVNEQISQSGGRVQSLKIAVIIDNKSPAAAGSSDALKQTIANASGVNPGDVSIQFSSFASDAASSSAAQKKSGLDPLLFGIAAGGALLVLILSGLLIHILTKQRKKQRLQQEIQRIRSSASEPPENAVGRAAPLVRSGAINSKMENEFAQDTEIGEIKKQLDDFADEKPEIVAQLIRNWLKD